MRLARRLALLATVSAMSGVALFARADDTAAPTSQPAAMPSSVYGFTVTDIDGKPVDLAQFRGHPLLIVNVASKCGFTPQYAGLEQLYQHYKDQGLVVIGFPANNFREQEPGTNEEIKAFCTGRYNVTFPMMSKISVKGDDKAPLFRYLTEPATAGDKAAEVSWNFNKFLIGKDGKLIAHFLSPVKPDAPELTQAIDAALAAQ